MNTTLKTCIIAIALTPVAAAAGNLEPVSETPQVLATDTTDWSGAYTGLGYSRFGGDIGEAGNTPISLDNSSQAQIFAGYQLQNGSFVYGGELAYGFGSATSAPGTVDPNDISKVIDLKARAGYAADKFMVYGILGYSRSEFDVITNTTGDEGTLAGISYGIGVDYAISTNFVIGAEYLARNLDGSIQGTSIETDMNSLSLRASYRF